MTVLLLTIGSAGDVHPFIGLGLALQKRGHRVKIITNPFFEPLTTKVGLELIPLGTVEQFDRIRNDPDLWHPTKGFRTIAQAVTSDLRKAYDAIVDNYVPGETVVAASSLGFGARIAQDKHQIPMATVHLAPAVFRSVIAPPKLPGLFMPGWLPRWVKSWMFSLGDRLVVDPLVAPGINRLRSELGLPPVRGILHNWWHSPQRVIGMFPDWFGPPPADWPSQTRLTGFPMYDETGVSHLSAELEEFLSAGSPPILFTPGSAMWHAHDLLRESAAACELLNCRGILLTGHAGHVPANLPANVRVFSYAPFSQVFPRCSIVVHHGGIGTSAQAMAAGVKQVITPFAHDQLDNARRMTWLGIARTVNPGRYRAESMAKLLASIQDDTRMTARCGEIARRFAGANGLERSCEWIESLNGAGVLPARSR